jgi:hypothetical protein
VPFGSLSCKYNAPSVIEGETSLKSNETEYWIREVSVDGQEMKITGYKDRKKAKVKSIWILDRIK